MPLIEESKHIKNILKITKNKNSLGDTTIL